GNSVVGSNNTSWPAILFEGGADNRITGNNFGAAGNNCSSPWQPPCGGGSQLQLNAGPNTNTGFDVWGNTFDSVGLLEIGLSDLIIRGNIFGDATLADSVGIIVIPAYQATSSNVTISNNFINLGGANAAYITGLSQAPGGQGSIGSLSPSLPGLTIDHNVVKGTVAYISLDGGCTSCPDNTNTYNSTITNNVIQSY